MKTRQKTYLMVVLILVAGLLAAKPHFRRRPLPLIAQSNKGAESPAWPIAIPLRYDQEGTESPAHVEPRNFAAAIPSLETREEEPAPPVLTTVPRIESSAPRTDREPAPSLLPPPSMLSQFPVGSTPEPPPSDLPTERLSDEEHTAIASNTPVLTEVESTLPSLPSSPESVEVPEVVIAEKVVTEEDGEAAGIQPAPSRLAQTHKIRDGDTLALLAQRYLGDSNRYLDIFAANRDRLADPDLLPIGRELIIPDREDYSSSSEQPDSDEDGARPLVPVHIDS